MDLCKLRIYMFLLLIDPPLACALQQMAVEAIWSESKENEQNSKQRENCILL